MNDEQWSALAAQNPQRVTYPSWRPPEHWAAQSKKDPWVPIKANREFWNRTHRKARKIPWFDGFRTVPVPADPPSGVNLEPRGRRNW